MKKGKLPKVEMAKARTGKFQRTKDGKWEEGTLYYDGSRLLAIGTKQGTLLCPPYKVK